MEYKNSNRGISTQTVYSLTRRAKDIHIYFWNGRKWPRIARSSAKSWPSEPCSHPRRGTWSLRGFIARVWQRRRQESERGGRRKKGVREIGSQRRIQIKGFIGAIDSGGRHIYVQIKGRLEEVHFFNWIVRIVNSIRDVDLPSVFSINGILTVR